MAETLLALRDISVRYGTSDVLEAPSLDVRRGEILAVMGPNGAGKSTLLRVMGLLQRPDRGTVWFRGSEVLPSEAHAARRRMATVFQEPLLLSMSVYDNVALGLRLRGWERRAIERTVGAWLERLGIAAIARRSARTISGGEAQRTSLARAFVLNPELLFLDEPFAALDPPTREALLVELEAILRETAVTTVFVTHDRNEALMLGDTIAVLLAGKILQIGSSEEVFFHPADEKVAEFVGTANILAGVVERREGERAWIRVAAGCWLLPCAAAAGAAVKLCIRPEEIAVIRAPGDGPPPIGRIRFQATVTRIVACGFDARVVLECGGIQLHARVARGALDGLCQRDQVAAEFSPAAVHVIAGS
ncbi:MAG TPA: ABC transporter ATP-binding protein [Candidatus Acidoferrales bacterium]|nr:ABC transporter ATP-binding protein [Candidatus Acidoferrales bacterium]